jgi:ArpU family phage transcriptional regulator
MKNTSSPEPRYHGATNAVGKPAEEVATWNVDKEKELEERYEQVTRAIDRLNRTEKQIIEKRYLTDEDVYDYNVFSEMHLSERKYYRVKSGAIYKLAFALRLERYVDADGA